MTRLFLFYFLFCCLIYGKITDDLPINVKEHIEAIKAFSKSNDWISAQNEFDKIIWKEVKNPCLVLEEVSKVIKSGGQEAKSLRREVKSKYMLLKEDGDPELEDSIDEVRVAYVKLKIQRFKAVSIDQVDLILIDVNSLNSLGLDLEYLKHLQSMDLDYLKYLGIDMEGIKTEKIDIEYLKAVGQIDATLYKNAIVVIVVREAKFLDAMEKWEKKYLGGVRQIDFFDSSGKRLIPAVNTILWQKRQALIKAIQNREDTTKLLEAYQDDFEKAIQRRIKLKKGKQCK